MSKALIVAILSIASGLLLVARAGQWASDDWNEYQKFGRRTQPRVPFIPLKRFKSEHSLRTAYVVVGWGSVALGIVVLLSLPLLNDRAY